MKKAIEIEEMRISSNGEHLEFIINCPADYQFTEFTIQVGDDDDEYSIAESLFYDEETGEYLGGEENRFIGQVPVNLFGVSEPEIYTIHLAAKYKLLEDNTEEELEIEEELNPCEETIEKFIYADAMISDVSQAYYCLMDDILSLDAKCSDKETQDRVIRNYLILYAHQEALRLGYIDEATKWFNMIANCFTGRCGKSKKRNVNEGCGCKALYSNKPKPQPQFNCGCHR